MGGEGLTSCLFPNYVLLVVLEGGVEGPLEGPAFANLPSAVCATTRILSPPGR